MLTYTGAISLYDKLTNNSESANETLGATLINEGVRLMISDIAWPFLEKNVTINTVASQQFYEIPADAQKVLTATITVGTTLYRPIPVFSRDAWDQLNAATGTTGDSVSYYYVFGSQIGFWPIPATSSNTITVNYIKQVRDISVADYTTGAIVTATNGDETIEGTSSPAWTANMAGKYLRITHTNAANTGDGIWYEISSITDSDTLELVDPYLGTSISAGAASYTIGDAMIIPESYQMGPVYFAVSEYWRANGDESRADRYEKKFYDLLEQMRSDEGRKTTDPSVDEGFADRFNNNPNLYLRNIS